MSSPPPENITPAHFQATRWSIVLAARERQTPEGEAALGWLCERYWQPLQTWARAKGLTPLDAEDLVQGFFAHAVKSGLVGSAQAERGKFRSYLLGCLEHYWATQLRRLNAQKRGGGVSCVPLHDCGEENSLAEKLSAGPTPAQEYDRVWALTILDRAMARLAAECDGNGNAGRFKVLRVFLEGERGEMSLHTVGETLGLSIPAVKSAIFRLRQRMAVLVREEIRETVPSQTDVERELRDLFGALRGEM